MLDISGAEVGILFLGKGYMVNILGFSCHMVCVSAVQHCSSPKVATDSEGMIVP